MYQSLLREQLESLKSSNQYRTFTTLSRICGHYPLAKLQGSDREPVVVWCSNDYLGMSQHPAVRQQMHVALETYGAGSGGSRNIGGSHELYARLEASLAEWHGKEAALVFPTGFGSNDATLQCLLRQIPDCVVASDAMNHASIVNGIRATPNERKVFRHNDARHLDEILSGYPLGQPKLVVFESIYSMDGDIAPIERIVEVAKRHNALTYLDEVHAVGMYGPRGAGIAAQLGLAGEIDIIQGTMAKAIGVIGGYIASSQVIVDAVVNSGPREDATRVGSAGVVRRQAVDVAPMRRINQAIYLITTGARESAFRNMKTIAECLADELINAAKGSSNSYAIKKKDEVERVAKANR